MRQTFVTKRVSEESMVNTRGGMQETKSTEKLQEVGAFALNISTNESRQRRLQPRIVLSAAPRQPLNPSRNMSMVIRDLCETWFSIAPMRWRADLCFKSGKYNRRRGSGGLLGCHSSPCEAAYRCIPKSAADICVAGISGDDKIFDRFLRLTTRAGSSSDLNSSGWKPQRGGERKNWREKSVEVPAFVSLSPLCAPAQHIRVKADPLDEL